MGIDKSQRPKSRQYFLIHYQLVGPHGYYLPEGLKDKENQETRTRESGGALEDLGVMDRRMWRSSWRRWIDELDNATTVVGAHSHMQERRKGNLTISALDPRNKGFVVHKGDTYTKQQQVTAKKERPGGEKKNEITFRRALCWTCQIRDSYQDGGDFTRSRGR